MFAFTSGDKYVDQFKDGYVDGYGINTWPDGSLYIGEWKDGK